MACVIISADFAKSVNLTLILTADVSPRALLGYLLLLFFRIESRLLQPKMVGLGMVIIQTVQLRNSETLAQLAHSKSIIVHNIQTEHQSALCIAYSMTGAM